MNTQIMTGNHGKRPFLMIALTLLILASLFSGACVTTSVMDYAKTKASFSNVTEFTIRKVHSAQIHENSDICVLVELGHPSHEKSGLYTMTVPLLSLIDNPDAIESFGLREKRTPSVYDLPTYLYPIGKAKKVNEEMVLIKDSAISPVRIEELNLHREEAERVLKLVGNLDKDPSGEQRIYTVNLLSDAVEEASEEEPGRTIAKNATIEKTILLVYSPPQSSSPHPRTIAVAGAYEDDSTNIYYLLVPPAIAFDAFLITVAVASGLSQMIPAGIGR